MVNLTPSPLDASSPAPPLSPLPEAARRLLRRLPSRCGSCYASPSLAAFEWAPRATIFLRQLGDLAAGNRGATAAAAGEEEPKALLEGVAVVGLVGILRQLGDLVAGNRGAAAAATGEEEPKALLEVVALKVEPTGTSSHIPPILDCAPAPGGAAALSNNLSAFSGNVLALLGALQPAAATGGFAAAQSSGAVVGDRAFGRAFCFGFGAHPRGSFPSDCLSCLSAAAQDVADGCHGRPGAVWRAGCFFAYADTNASTPREEAWRGWFYDDRAGRGLSFYDDAPATACMATSTAPECAQCLNDSAQVVPALKQGRQLSLVHGYTVVVLGYSCYLSEQV